MRVLITLALLAVLLPLATQPSWADAGSSVKSNQFFRAENVNSRWWLISPGGHRFISKGVTTVEYAPDVIHGTDKSPYLETNQVKYRNPVAWRKAVATRLIGWGFNSLGAWSDEAVSETVVDNQRLAYTPLVDLGADFVSEKQKGAAWLHGMFPDVFDPDFETMAHQFARER